MALRAWHRFVWGPRVHELLLIFNLCAFNWNSAEASTQRLSLWIWLLLWLWLWLWLCPCCGLWLWPTCQTNTHRIALHRRLGQNRASNMANKLQTSRRQNRKQHKFSHIFGLRSMGTCNQKSTSRPKKKAGRVETWKELYGLTFLLPAGRKFITLIKIILN